MLDQKKKLITQTTLDQFLQKIVEEEAEEEGDMSDIEYTSEGGRAGGNFTSKCECECENVFLLC